MKLDDQDFLVPQNLRRPYFASKINNPPMFRTPCDPFDRLIMVQAFFQLYDSEHSQKISANRAKSQTGTGLLLAPNKVLTSAGLLLCKKTGQYAKYVLLQPSAKQTPSSSKPEIIKSKNFQFNQDLSFEMEQKKMFNNFAIIFAEQSLVIPQKWQPLEFDWSYGEEYDAFQDLKVVGYRRSEGSESYQKVFRRLKVYERKLGVLETQTELFDGEEGSVVMTAQISPQKEAGIIYKVVGLLTESQARSTSAIEFGYLVDSKQVLRKDLRTLGFEVLLRFPASRGYQDLLKQNQKLERHVNELKQEKLQKLSAQNQVELLKQRIIELSKANSQLSQSLQSQAEQTKKQFDKQSRLAQKQRQELQQAVLSEKKPHGKKRSTVNGY